MRPVPPPLFRGTHDLFEKLCFQNHLIYLAISIAGIKEKTTFLVKRLFEVCHWILLQNNSTSFKSEKLAYISYPMTTKVRALWGYCDSVQDRPVFITHKEDPARVETSENPVKIGRFSIYILLQLMFVGFLNQTWESTTTSLSPHCASLATHHTQDLGTAA